MRLTKSGFESWERLISPGRTKVGKIQPTPARAFLWKGETSECGQEATEGLEIQGTTSPARTDLGCQVPLLPQQALTSGVTLQHTLQCWCVIPCHLLLHVQDADV